MGDTILKVPTFENIISEWVHKFACSLDDLDDLRCGDNSGVTPKGVYICFDGYAEDSGDIDFNKKDSLSFAVFIHKESLKSEFPEHDIAYGCIVHRPKEEMCIYCWLDRVNNNIDVLTENINLDDKNLESKLLNLAVQIWHRDNMRA